MAEPRVARSGRTVARWSVFEIELRGPSRGNPYVDVDITARFTSASTTLEVEGFYDGEGTYRVRFAPVELGAWSWVTVERIIYFGPHQPRQWARGFPDEPGEYSVEH